MRNSGSIYNYNSKCLYGVYAAVSSILRTKPVVENVKQTTVPEPEIIAQNLNIPWELAFLPNGSMFVTQRSGEFLLIGKDVTIIKKIPGVKNQ